MQIVDVVLYTFDFNQCSHFITESVFQCISVISIHTLNVFSEVSVGVVSFQYTDIDISLGRPETD